MHLLLHNIFVADSAPGIVVRKPVVHRWPVFDVTYRFPWIQLFLLFLSSVIFLVTPCHTLASVEIILRYQHCFVYISSHLDLLFHLFDVRLWNFSWQYHEYRQLPAIIFHLHHTLFRIAITTGIQNLLQQNMVLNQLFSNLAWQFLVSAVFYQESSN